MKVTSPAFNNGGIIPEKYGYSEQNLSLPLNFSGVPETAETLVVIMDDPDARSVSGKIWDHWTVWNIPAEVRSLREGEVPEGAVEGSNDFGNKGYGGPNPPSEKHVYRIRVYALNRSLDLEQGSSKEEVLGAMEDHIIAKGELKGSYSP